MLDNSQVYDKAYAFAVRVVKASQFLEDRRAYVLARQFLKSGTAIGANLAEANGAISSTDFPEKVSIAYKECQETKYWISLLKDTGYFNENMSQSLHQDADELAKILYAILKTTRIQ